MSMLKSCCAKHCMIPDSAVTYLAGVRRMLRRRGVAMGVAGVASTLGVAGVAAVLRAVVASTLRSKLDSAYAMNCTA